MASPIWSNRPCHAPPRVPFVKRMDSTDVSDFSPSVGTFPLGVLSSRERHASDWRPGVETNAGT
jgi:hypothetical protein